MKRLLVVLLLLVSGCSLPLPDGVKSVAGVPTEQDQSGDLLQVDPPGPRQGQSPLDVVLGFLRAQANAADRHAIARRFLTDEQARTWDDTARVEVYEVGSAHPSLSAAPPVDSTAEAVVTVTAQVVGAIGADGAYTPLNRSSSETYRARRTKGEWRLSSVPAGLRLTPPDRDRSYRPADVYYLGQASDDAVPHLVPDRVFLPTGPDLPGNLVRRLLQEPTSSLVGSVAHEPGLTARQVRTDGTGVVTVDLDARAATLGQAAREALSAQLVWTLRGLEPSFSGLRLQAGGKALRVRGQGAVQDDGAWEAYDPERTGPNPPYLYVAGRRLRASGLTLPSNPATAGDANEAGSLPVDGVALTPDRTTVALLEGVAPLRVTVRTGPLRGPYRRAVTDGDLRSPSFGSGDRGLWLVRDRSEVVLLPPGASRLVRVPVVDPRPPGSLTSLAVSRDGARIALVLGEQLYVGRVEVTGDGPRIAGLRRLLVDVRGDVRVTDAAWASGTELAVVSATRGGVRQLRRVAVDGSTVEVLNTSTLQPLQVAASSAGLLFTVPGALYSLTGRAPSRPVLGSAPAYPG